MKVRRMRASAAIDDSPHDDDDAPLPGTDADFGFGKRRAAPPPPTPVADPLVGALVGDVRLERLIDEGGMGRVYLGRQLRPDRAVAVKMIRSGMCTPAVLRRFERESESLARLRHPGIAQIHSFGTCSVAGAEMPYFVMEYVAEGRPITEDAAARGLATRERLELFRQVCDAVGHAHSRGILHRDLKPANILVDEDERAKIIDFGVARHLDRDTILTTGFDDIGRLVGTLSYIAPELFRGDAGTTDVRIDVYALGVVLYELLAGRPPFDLRRAVLAQAARVVLEDDPPPLSSASPGCGRDIARVVGQAMEKDPQRRYASVAELAADVDRCLHGEPVLARAWPPWRRLVRLWRRHTAAVAFGAGAAAVVACILAGVALSRIGWSPRPLAAAAGASTSRESAAPPVRRVRRHRLADLSATEAASLQPEQGYLVVQVPRLTPEAAAVLATKACHLSLTLDEIDRDVARALAEQVGGLDIVGIRTIAEDVAAELAKLRTASLNLDSIDTLSRTACERLAAYEGWLNLNGLREWPEGGLEAIVKHDGGLSIWVGGLLPEQANLLATHHGHLYVLGVESIDESVARALLRHQGRLDLWKAFGITPAAAAILRQRPDIIFPGQ
jgi:predicted Ser/Thr protein kinase